MFDNTSTDLIRFSLCDVFVKTRVVNSVSTWYVSVNTGCFNNSTSLQTVAGSCGNKLDYRMQKGIAAILGIV